MKTLITASCLALALALSPVALSPASAHGGQMKSSPHAEHAPYDVQFLDTMSQHHRDGIHMMEMALDKAQSKDVHDMAKRGIADQKKDIDQMRDLRKHVQADAPKAINMKLPGMMSMNTQKLESAAGHTFDHHYLEMMIHHHQGGVKMADNALAKAQHAEVKTKAKEIHDKQKQEIAEMQKMLKSMK